MKKYNLLFLCVFLANCTSSAQKVELEFDFPDCGESTLNSMKISKICATRDFIATPLKKQKKDWLSFLAAEGSSGYKGHNEIGGGIQEFKNQELDMKNHVWDFSHQTKPNLLFRGHDTIIKNGIILNTEIELGGGIYAPNFSNNQQNGNSDVGNNGFLYAHKFTSGAYDDSVENMFLSHSIINSPIISLTSWGGGLLNSKIIISESIRVDSSRSTIQDNTIFSDVNLNSEKKLFLINLKKNSVLADKSDQVFPDRWDDKMAIPATLYVKFSPDTVIDGNTFTLTKRNDYAYAIVLDHSPRVRIINNTFNGFKVPILMDQWSSIVDEKGNVINPDQFSGDVTMNRKGEIVKK